MAKLSSINKNERRKKLVKKYAGQYARLKAIANDESKDDSERLIEQVGAVLDGGARILQYRNKGSDTVRRLWQASILVSLARSRNALFIIRIINSAAILRAHVITLAHALRWVVVFPEHTQHVHQ